MDNFENRIIRGIHTSRYIASWTKTYPIRERYGIDRFRTWLKGLKINDGYLTDEEVMYIISFATNGKLELEYDVDKRGPRI